MVDITGFTGEPWQVTMSRTGDGYVVHLIIAGVMVVLPALEAHKLGSALHAASGIDTSDAGHRDEDEDPVTQMLRRVAAARPPVEWNDEKSARLAARMREEIGELTDGQRRAIIEALGDAGHQDEEPSASFARARSLLGQRVKATLVRDSDDPAAIAEGRLLRIGEGGEMAIEDDDGFVSYCWPMLDIEATVDAGHQDEAKPPLGPVMGRIRNVLAAAADRTPSFGYPWPYTPPGDAGHQDETAGREDAPAGYNDGTMDDAEGAAPEDGPRVNDPNVSQGPNVADGHQGAGDD